MTNLNAFISASAVVGVILLSVGVIVVMSGGGTMEQVMALSYLSVSRCQAACCSGYQRRHRQQS